MLNILEKIEEKNEQENRAKTHVIDSDTSNRALVFNAAC